MRERVLTHLAALVGFDTRNPPRRIGAGGIFDYLRANLPGFEFELQDHGAGAVSLLARRGQCERVFNVHLDTVPDSPGWSADPHVLRVTDERAIGLGACDTKGAAACLLAAAERSDGPLALLFSSDEEANDARCIASFLATDRGFREAIVAEPTQAQAVLAHRGISSARIAPDTLSWRGLGEGRWFRASLPAGFRASRPCRKRRRRHRLRRTSSAVRLSAPSGP